MNNLLPVEMEHPECLVCGSDAKNPFLTVADRFDISQKYQLVQCQDCGFVYLSPRPGQKWISRYYQDPSYQPHQKKALSLSGKAYQAVRIWNNRYKHRLIEKYSRRGKILDYGCGTGEFLLEMKNSGWDTLGLEPSAEAAAVARNYQIPIIPALNSFPGKVDVITLWHVLEHVHEARRLLADLKNILQPTGLLCIAIPNRRSLDAAFFKNHWVAYDAPRHLYHFSPADMEKLLQSAGFKIFSMRSLPFDPWYNSFLSAYLESGKNKMRLLSIGLVKSLFAGITVNVLSVFNKKYNSSIIYLARPVTNN